MPGTNGPTGQNAGQNNPELSFEDFTAMSPFLDPAALHLNPYAAAAASSTGRHTFLKTERSEVHF